MRLHQSVFREASSKREKGPPAQRQEEERRGDEMRCPSNNFEGKAPPPWSLLRVHHMCVMCCGCGHRISG